jgi:acyl carrier protein
MKPTPDIVASWLAQLPTTERIGIVGESTDLIDEGILDSIAILNLVAFLEDHFNLTIPVEEFIPENFRTVAAISDLADRLGERPR